MPAASSAPFAAALALCSAGCGAEEAAPPSPRGAAPTSPPTRSLRALGYAGWDEGADARRTGVVLHDRTRAAAGVNLYTDDVDQAYAVDMQGERLHTWRIPGRSQVEHFAPLSGGRIVAVSVDQGVTLVDRESRVLWHTDLAAHHDVTPLDGGAAGFLVPVYEEREYRGRRVRFDRIVRLDAGGRPVSSWSTWERREELAALHAALALDREPPRATEPTNAVYDYHHLNSVSVLPASDLGRADPRFAAGNLLVCLRNVSIIAVLRHDSHEANWHEVTWSWGPGELDFPHMPSLTPDGTILVFDNGRHRGHSRVLEIDPLDAAIVWSFQADPPEAFFSELRGSCQRLWNGNTLVCESDRGRAFEVTPEGEIVWEYYNPELSGNRRKRIYRLTRLPPGRFEALMGR